MRDPQGRPPPRRIPSRAATLLALVLASVVTAYGAPPSASVPAAAASPVVAVPAAGERMAAAAVQIKDFAFAPSPLTVAAGTTVTWTNQDRTAHTVTADDGSFDSGRIAPGATFQHTFAASGTVAYHCTIHPGMRATVVVR
ncbi:cupredoxin family copper-binding protein [Georgenia sp. SYP-B2076]|uniref:cupredoxin domain-containing protein n=1 Tax=Georgenia sp. SYP-B2076 TaxID=2495881 RepID=UPI000F8E6978|nr:cupredoxin family copper-binding protein [Georgenia sp. SYP-B2076]